MSEPPAAPLRLGVLGCGRVFQRFHLPAIGRVPARALIAACDTEPARLAGAEHWSTHPALFSSPTELFRSPGLDALLVLTPPLSHADIVVQAMEIGLHVLVEKPMSLDLTEGRRMARAARMAQRHLQVGFTRRFREPYRRLRSAVQQLDPRQLSSVRFELAFSTSSWSAQTDFLGHDSLGGGVLDDLLSHQVDLVCWMLGAVPDEVRAVVSASARGAVHAELRIGSLVAHCHAAHAPYAERLEIEMVDGTVLEASGSGMRSTGNRLAKGRRYRALVMDRLALVGARLRRQPNVTLASFERQLRDFEQAVRGGRSEGATAEDGLLAVAVVQACRVSAGTGGAWLAVGLSARPAA